MTIPKYNDSHSNMWYAHYTLVKDSLSANLYTSKFKNQQEKFDIIQAKYYTILNWKVRYQNTLLKHYVIRQGQNVLESN